MLRSDSGNRETALRDVDESLEQFEALGHRNGMAWASYREGTILADLARYAEARTILEQSLTHFKHLAVAMGIAMTHSKLTSVALAQNDPQHACQHAASSLHCYQQMHQQTGMSLTIEHIAMLIAERDAIVAVQLLGCAQTQLADIRTHIAFIDQPLYAQTLSTLHTHLAEADFATAWEEGQALPLDQAVALAQQACDAPHWLKPRVLLGQPVQSMT